METEKLLASDNVKAVHPVALEIVVAASVKSIMYKSFSGKIINHYKSNNRIKILFPNLSLAIEAIDANKTKIISYLIYCNQLVVGDNFLGNYIQP